MTVTADAEIIGQSVAQLVMNDLLLLISASRWQ